MSLTGAIEFLGRHADAADGRRHRDHASLARHSLNLFKQGSTASCCSHHREGTSFNVGERIATVEALLKAGVAASRIGLGGGFPAITVASR